MWFCWRRLLSVARRPDAGFVAAVANVAKRSFWGPQCRELIGKDIGRWMLEKGYAHWPKGSPPQFEVEPAGRSVFCVKKCVTPG